MHRYSYKITFKQTGFRIKYNIVQGVSLLQDQSAFDQTQFQPWDIGKNLQGGYIVQKILGQGGMGTVYLVEKELSSGRLSFAVKTLLASILADESKKRQFLSELRTWIDLPDHPNLTACYFFRTIEDRLTVFSEYIGGGSLRDWIVSHRLNTVKDILDVAIQFAWGLHAAHECGVIHQDVKPGNVLITEDSLVKVTDFGLARALEAGGIESSYLSSTGANLVSSNGMTLAYCSPEQAMGEKLNRRTDIWSWGLSVLEMFNGDVSWKIGTLAEMALSMYLENGPVRELPAMPERVQEVLLRAFRENPADRWKNLDQAAGELMTAYAEETGTAYPRKKPPFTHRKTQKKEHKRRLHTGSAWEDPMKLLQLAYHESGEDISGFRAQLPERKGSRKAQALVDLEILGEAERIFSRLIQNGRADLRFRKAGVFYLMGFVNRASEDPRAAIDSFERAAGIFEALNREKFHEDHFSQMVSSFINMGIAHLLIGDFEEAIQTFDKGLEMYRQYGVNTGQTGINSQMAILYLNKANALWRMRKTKEASLLYDPVIESYERQTYLEGKKHIALPLSKVYQNKALTLWDIGEIPGAIDLFSRAIVIMEECVHDEKRVELTGELAMFYTNYAMICADIPDYETALTYYQRAIDLIQKLYEEEPASHLREELARAYYKKGETLMKLKKYGESWRCLDESASLLVYAVREGGQHHLVCYLALLYGSMSEVKWFTGDIESAGVFHEDAVKILEQEAGDGDKTELDRETARIYTIGGYIREHEKDYTGAAQKYEKAACILNRMDRAGDKTALEIETVMVNALHITACAKSGMDQSDAGEIRIWMDKLKAVAGTERNDEVEQVLADLEAFWSST
jgi:serine/threonine protein kinase